MGSFRANAAHENVSRAGSPRQVEPGDRLVFVGTYTDGSSKGIHLFRLVENADAKIGVTLEPLGLAAEARNPSFLEIDPKRRLLFAVSEAADANGRPGGAVSSYAIGNDGRLTLINQQSTCGAGPCHLALDKTGRFLLAANYGGGSVVVLPVAEDGRLGEATDFVQHEGSSVNPQRQAGPHAHFVATDPTNRFALVCDLGLDQVLVYRFDSQRGKLTPNDPPAADLKPGAGPRHLAFHPNGKFVYVINELDSTVTVFNFNADDGSLRELHTARTLPSDFTGENTTAEVAVHPSGRFLYGSNRGHDSIAMFAIDEKTGELTSLGAESTQGQTPRHFELDPQGELLIAANQNSDTLLVYRIDQQSGHLHSTGNLVECPTPVCVKFLEPAAASK
ncbi:MAG TPA: lactonase family protein [Lacipirellula sp.]